MKKTIEAFLSIGLVMIPCLVARAAGEEEAYIPQKVIILGSYKNYPQALKSAKEIGSKADLPFSARGMIYDKKAGLVWPKDFEDEMWAGGYAVRRYNKLECDDREKSCITIERSRFYQGMEPGYYIVVGGIFSADDDEADKTLQSLQGVVPDAYAKVSKVYMGCMH